MKNNKKKNVVTRQTDLGLLKHPGCSGREMPGGRLKQIQRRRLGIQWEWLESTPRWREADELRPAGDKIYRT